MGSLGNARLISQQADKYVNDIRKALRKFEKRDRKKILRKAARPVRKTARALTPRRSGTAVNRRYDSTGKLVAIYHPGNLRRGMKTLSFRRSEDVFIGPQFAKRKVSEYGKPGQPVDAYYAAMVYGSAEEFNRRVLSPALQQNLNIVIGTIKKEAESKILLRVLSTRRL